MSNPPRVDEGRKNPKPPSSSKPDAARMVAKIHGDLRCIRGCVKESVGDMIRVRKYYTEGGRLRGCDNANERTVAINITPRILHVVVAVTTITPVCNPGMHGGQTAIGAVNTTVDVSPAHAYPRGSVRD